MALTFRRLQDEQRAWSEYNFGPTTPENANDSFLGVVEEVGELAHAILKAKQGIRGVTPEHLRALAVDAVADITIFLANWCSRNNIDYEDAVQTVWDAVKQRDWVRYPKNGLTE